MRKTPRKKFCFKEPSILPGFGLAIGITMSYLGLIVIVPLAGLFVKASSLTLGEFWAAVASPRVVASYKLSFFTSFAAASVNAVFGFLTAWVLARYDFPGKKAIDSLIELPFALPTAVAGISLTMVLGPGGWIGQWLEPLGIRAAYTPLGIIVALVFIGLPFVVRTVQPVLEDMEKELEEAAACLGAGRFKTFIHVIFPAALPALLTGFALAFARAVGEYGSVVFISGNMPMKTEITPLLIMTKLEQYDYAGAAAVAAVMLSASFLLLLGINLLQWRSGKCGLKN